MKSRDEHLKDLWENNPEEFNFVANYMEKDRLGLLTPEEKTGGCNPPCSGPGSTPNGHWACNSGSCVWIPAL